MSSWCLENSFKLFINTKFISIKFIQWITNISLSNCENIKHLIIPGSVNECSLNRCKFISLIFEDSDIQIKLTLSNVQVAGKLRCVRYLTNNSSVNTTDLGYVAVSPSVLECHIQFLNLLNNDYSLGNYKLSENTTLVLYYLISEDDDIRTGDISHPLKFYKIFTTFNYPAIVSPLETPNLTATTQMY